MKRLNRSLLLFTLTITSGCSSAQVTWNTDGSFNKNGQRITTSLNNSYLGFESEHGVFVAGYKIDTSGENLPYIALLENNKTIPIEWPIGDSALQFFKHESTVQLATYRGEHYVFTNMNWKKGALVFKRDSLIISDESTLLACNRPSPFKAAKDTSSCYSPALGWSKPLHWVAPEPQICNGKLAVIAKINGELNRLDIDVSNGDLLSKESYQSNRLLCTQ